MRRLGTLLALLLFPLIAFSITEKRETSNMLEIYQTVTQVIRENPNTLVVFDLDNTIIKAKEVLGSDQWFTWKSDQILKKDPSLYQDLLAWLQIIMNLAPMSLTEPELPKMMTTMQTGSFPIIALTSRGPELREATEKELRTHGIDFSKRAIGKGFPSTFIPQGFSRNASYMNGIFMTSGQHKGDILLYLLKRYKIQNKITQIIFVDDHKKHTDRMHDTFSKTPIDILTFRYSREDNAVQRFHSSPQLKSKTDQQLKTLSQTLKGIFKRVPRAIY